MHYRWLVLVTVIVLVGFGLSLVRSIPMADAPAEDVGFVMVTYDASHNETVNHSKQELQKGVANRRCKMELQTRVAKRSWKNNSQEGDCKKGCRKDL